MSNQADVILAMKSVTRTFMQAGQKVEALKKTDFTIRAGEMVAIIGPSGSGKTTFLTIAGGLQNPTHGTVTIRGKNITKLSQKQLSAIRLNEVGFILQASNLVPFLTVEKQLKLLDRVYKRPTDTKAMAALFETLQMEKNHTKYPSDLSGGERQRAAIAKVLYGNSSLILADEPTASLDTTRAFEVMSLLKKETHERNKATIIVTHDERLLKYCDAVYEMHDGELKKRAS